MTPLATPCEVIDLAFADTGYLPADALSPADIAAAEHRYIVPVTGRRLWQRLAEGAYPELKEDYVLPAAASAVRLAVQPTLDLRSGLGGTTVPRTSASQPAERERIAAARRSLRARLSVQLRTLSDHLDSHRKEFPEYDPATDVLRRVLVAGGIVLKT